MLDPLLEPEFAVADRSEHYRPQNYRTEWENNPLFREWITKGVSSKRARCKVCDIEMTADICVIKSHGRGIKHLRRLRGDIPESDLRGKCTSYNPKWEREEEYKGWLRPGRVPFKAECKLCDVEFRAEKTVLRNHVKSRRHQRSLSHDKRVKEAAELWASGRSPSLRVPVSSPPDTDSDSGDPSAEKPPSEEQLAQRLTSYIVKGYQRLRARCLDCQSPLLRDKAGNRLCVVCNPAGPDGHLLSPDAEQESRTDVTESLSAEDSNDFFSQDSNNDLEEEKMDIEIEGKPCNLSDDEEAFTLFGMVHVEEELQKETNKCIIQGQDMSTEVRELVQALLERVTTQSVQVSAGQDTQVALARLDKIVGLLNKIKSL